MQILPISTQTFENIRLENRVYVDKTKYAYEILNNRGCYFLSRPRRFGKSLFLSTLMELAKGRRELFEGTWIEDKWDWSLNYPVIDLEFAGMAYEETGLGAAIIKRLLPFYEKNQIEIKSTNLKDLFHDLIVALDEKYGKVVILIDEYDKPILDTIEREMPQEQIERKRVLKSFYSVLKGCEKHIHCTFITGIAKFTKIAIFSDLNHLNDITLNYKFTTAYGYTQEELEASFSDYLNLFLEENEEYTMETLLAEIKDWYNGYSWDGKTRVYNPYGIIHFFENKYFINSWYNSGSPTFLVKKLMEANNLTIENVAVNANFLDFKDVDRIELTILMFQTGYLTIKEMDKQRNAILDYPNREVRESMYHYILDEKSGNRSRGIAPIHNFANAFHNNDMYRLEELVQQVFYELAYDVYSNQSTKQVEVFYHGIVNVLFRYVGLYVQSEVHTTRGRADSIVETDKYVYVFEFKIDETAAIALKQIHDKDYARKYLAPSFGKTVILIGANFSTKTRYMDDWAVEVQ